MSSLPGLDLEDYLAWYFDIKVEDQKEANFSLGVAELLGNIPKRKTLSKEQFAVIVEKYEPYREIIEYRLSDFDEETQSWRDYQTQIDDYLSETLYDKVKEYINSL